MSILDRWLLISMPDGSRWAVPIKIIAESRAKYYAENKDITEALNTLALFESDEDKIKNWAADAMTWVDVCNHAVKIEPPDLPDYQEGWANGDSEVVDAPEGVKDGMDTQ